MSFKNGSDLVQSFVMRRPRAIVCDDDGVILFYYTRILKAEGYEVVSADSPTMCAFYEGNSKSCPLNARCADLIITGNDMPGMSGIELFETQHLGGCKLTSQNKALITGNRSPMLKKRAEALGSQLFLKPLSLSTLLAWLKECQGRIDLSEPLASSLSL